MAFSDSPAGTVLFSTVGRCTYGFDIFSVQLTATSTVEHRLTDGTSINFNGSFADDDNNSLVFVSERSGSPRIYLTRPDSGGPPELLPSAPCSLFHDRPILRGGKLFFVSAHEPADILYKSWSAVYSADIGDGDGVVVRLTPKGVVDYSPAVSPSGQLLAVASYGSKPWGGEFHELDAEIVVFPVSDPTKRTVLASRGGWPTWSGESTVLFHRESEDGWWSIYRVDYPAAGAPSRVTPPGLHAFTTAAFHDGKRIAVATRRKESNFRHIEIFDTETGEFQPVTKLINPELHHYNPFVSPGSSEFLGYHRFRGESTQGDSIIPNLEPVGSPFKTLNMLRINGNFPAYSPEGDLIAYNPDFISGTGITIVKSDGSKRWKLIVDRVAFYNSWNPADKNVIFTSIGGIFQPAHSTVQIARITFDAANLDPQCPDIPNVDVKILTKESTGNNAFPACSPDGKSIVFRSGRSGHKNLYIMDAVNGEFDGGYIRQLTDGAWTDTMPSWSQDGELVVFSSNRHDPTNAVTFGIYVIRADGSGLRRVHVEGSREVEIERINHVCFSPNGEWLLFTANMGGVTAEPVSLPNQFQPYGDLFVVRLDGSELRRLTWNGYENGTPAWHSRVDYLDIDEEIRRLSLNVDVDGKNVDGEKLKGQFQEPLWITCDF